MSGAAPSTHDPAAIRRRISRSLLFGGGGLLLAGLLTLLAVLGPWLGKEREHQVAERARALAALTGQEASAIHSGDALRRDLLRLRVALALGGAIWLAVLAWLIGRVLRAELRPLESAVEQFEASLERERRMSSNIAHELRTPVAELRSLADVGARWPDDPQAVAEFFADVREISLRRERTINDLLRLARSEGGVEKAKSDPVDLPKLIDGVWAPLADAAVAHHLTYRAEVEDGLVLHTDAEKLRLILHNLLTNAISYSRPGGEIRLRGVRDVDGCVRIHVVNPPKRLEADDLPHMFERFWRGDVSRSSHLNAGLGLSIVRAFADLLDLEISTRLADGILTVELRSRPHS